MEMNYNLPLELSCLIFAQKQDSDQLIKVVVRYKAFIQWDSIISIEEFIKHELFPKDEESKKSIIITNNGQYIIEADIYETGQLWASYKLWKSKQVLKPLFGIN